MAEGIVSQKFTGDSTDAQNAIAALEKKMEQVESRLRSTQEAAKKAAADKRALDQQAARDLAKLDADKRKADQEELKRKAELLKKDKELVSGVGDWAASLTGVNVTFAGIAAGVSGLISQHAELVKASREYTDQLDQQRRVLMNLAGLDAMESKDMQKQLRDVAKKNKVSVEYTMKTAQALSSVGFQPGDLVSGADYVARAMSAQGDLTTDPQTAVESFAKLLEVRGKSMTTKSLQEEITPFHLLSKPTTMSFKDLQHVAPKSAVVHSAVKDSLMENALQALVIRVTNAENSTTAVQSFVSELMAARADETKVKAIAKMQIADPATGKSRPMTPEDIDFVNEDLKTILDRLAGGLKPFNEAEQATILSQMFGKGTNMSLAKVIIQDRGQLDALVAAQKNTAQFDVDVGNFQRGPAAMARDDKNTADAYAERVSREQADRVAVLDKLFWMNRDKYATGGPEWLTGEGQNWMRYGYARVQNALGMPDSAMSSLAGADDNFTRAVGMPGGGRKMIQEALNQVQGMKGEPLSGLETSNYYNDFAREQADLMKQQNALVQQQNQKLDELNKNLKNAIPQPPAAQPQRPPIKRPVPAGVDRE